LKTGLTNSFKQLLGPSELLRDARMVFRLGILDVDGTPIKAIQDK
jgi:hypothetical protein